MDGYDGWDDLSDWFDRKQGDGGDLWHWTLAPALFKVLGDCRRKKVLDLVCGNGYLSRRLARQGADVTGVDASPRMVANARAHGTVGVKYLCSDASNLKDVSGGKFDVVFANMSLMDMPDAEKAVGEAARVLNRGGRFVSRISRPCFEAMSNSGWGAEKVFSSPLTVYRKVRGYREPFYEMVRWNIGDGAVAHMFGYHRPLNWYARVLRPKGIATTALEAPQPTRELIETEQKQPGDLDGAGLQEVPLHLVIEAVKL